MSRPLTPHAHTHAQLAYVHGVRVCVCVCVCVCGHVAQRPHVLLRIDMNADIPSHGKRFPYTLPEMPYTLPEVPDTLPEVPDTGQVKCT